jgi:hypothetical protein
MPIISFDEGERVTPFLRYTLQSLRDDEQRQVKSRGQDEDSLTPILEYQICNGQLVSSDAVECKDNEDEESLSDNELSTIFGDTDSVHDCNSENTHFSDYQVGMDEDENENEHGLLSRPCSLSEFRDLL